VLVLTGFAVADSRGSLVLGLVLAGRLSGIRITVGAGGGRGSGRAGGALDGGGCQAPGVRDAGPASGAGEGFGAPCAALRAAFRPAVLFFLRAIFCDSISSRVAFLMPGYCVFWTTIALCAP